MHEFRYWHKADISCTTHVRYWGKADMMGTSQNVR